MSPFSSFGKKPMGETGLDARVRSLEKWHARLGVAFLFFGGLFGYEHYYAIPKLVDESHIGTANQRIAALLAQAEGNAGQISTAKDNVIALATAAGEAMPLQYKTVQVGLCTGEPGSKYPDHVRVHKNNGKENFDRFTAIAIPNARIVGAWCSVEHHVMDQQYYTHIIPEIHDGKVDLLLNAAIDTPSLMVMHVHCIYVQDQKQGSSSGLATASARQ
jgi:hypothetical protein